METDQDHVHLLIGYRPNVAVSEMVRQLKQDSTYQMWKPCIHTPKGMWFYGCKLYKDAVSRIKSSLIDWIPIRSQLYLLIEIYVILNFDVKMNLLHNFTPREWMCNELLKEQKKEITPEEA